MSTPREQVAQSAAKKLAASAAQVASIQAMVGLDGFVDEIIAVVDKWVSPGRYEPVKTIDALAAKIARAAGQSSNYELQVKQMKLGGNGPIMANALASLGMKVTYIGNLGYPTIHPVFADFARRAQVISIAEPGHTDALEFSDGKLMLGKHASLHDVSWENLVSRVGRDRLAALVNAAQLIGMVNWTMLPHMSRIWSHLIDEVFPALEKRKRTLFVDLADPEKRTAADITDALRLLTRFAAHADVVLGLNLKESSSVAEVLGIPVPGEAEGAIEQTARSIRAALDLSCVVIHPRRSAAAADAQHSATFLGPFVQEPKISTGAGDHFNAGFCLGRVLGFTLEESLCCGVATSGYYVRTADSPTAAQLIQFLSQLPAPQ